MKALFLDKLAYLSYRSVDLLCSASCHLSYLLLASALVLEDYSAWVYFFLDL